MVKPPKIRHSKSRKDPVTIDLDAKDVVRETPDQAAARPSPEPKPSEPAKAAEAARPEDLAAPSGAEAAGKAKDGGAATSPTASAAAQPSSSASRATGSAFGRQPQPGTSTTTQSPSSAGAAAAKPSPDSSAATPSPKPGAPSRLRSVSALAAGVIGGVIAFGLAAGLQAAGVLPFGDGSALVEQPTDVGPGQEDLDALRAEVAALREQTKAAPNAPQENPAAQQALSDLGERLDQLAAAVDELRAAPAVAAVVDAATGEELTGLSEKVAALEGSVSTLTQSVDPSALQALSDRIEEIDQGLAQQAEAAGSVRSAQADLTARLDAIEQRIAALGETIEGQPRMALAIAATALKAAIDRGDPFAAELDTYAAVAPEPTPAEPLRALAAEGVPTQSEIESSMSQAAIAMIEAARPVDPDAGLVDRLMTSARSLVSVRPIGAVEGEGVPAIVARMEAAVKAGDYDAALAEYETLPEPAKAAGAALAADIRARREAENALLAIMADALRPSEDEPGNTQPPAAQPANGGRG